MGPSPAGVAPMDGFLISVYAGEDVSRPTFFELVAQEQLMDSLRPALSFIVNVYAERCPPWMLPLLSRWDAIQSALCLWLEARGGRTQPLPSTMSCCAPTSPETR